MGNWSQNLVLAGIGVVLFAIIVFFAHWTGPGSGTAPSSTDVVSPEESKTPPEPGVVVVASGTINNSKSTATPPKKRVSRPKPLPEEEDNEPPRPLTPAEAVEKLQAAGVKLELVAGVNPAEVEALAEEAKKKRLSEQKEAQEGVQGASVSTDEKSEKVESEPAKSASDSGTQGPTVVRGSVDELTLLKKAKASLAKLYQLRLRTNVPPVVSENEARRLSEILEQLSPETEKEIRAIIRSGYGSRMITGNRTEGRLDGSDRASEPTSENNRNRSEPGDLKALNSRIGSLERTHKSSPRAAGTPTPEPSSAAPTYPSAGGGPPPGNDSLENDLKPDKFN